jgi:hypothetical protein
MRRRIIRVIIAVPLALIAIAAGAALCLPAVRHIVWGVWNLPALPDNSQMHYRPDAEGFARDVRWM